MGDQPTDEQLRDIADPWHALDYDLGELRVLAARLARELLTAAKARRIETDAELHAVGRGVVVRAKDGTIAARFDERFGVVFGDDRPFSWSALHAPATVLFDPAATQCGHGYNLTDSCPGCDADTEERDRD